MERFDMSFDSRQLNELLKKTEDVKILGMGKRYILVFYKNNEK